MKIVVNGWDYGYRFTNVLRKRKLTQWVKVLLYLNLFGESRRKEVAFYVWGFDKEHINSNHDIFSALHKDGLIRYNPSTKKWFITDFGKQYVINASKNINKNIYLNL